MSKTASGIAFLAFSILLLNELYGLYPIFFLGEPVSIIVLLYKVLKSIVLISLVRLSYKKYSES
jgi:hypothetical protein